MSSSLRTQSAKSLRQSEKFSWPESGSPLSYESLKDPSLAYFFAKPMVQKHLMENGWFAENAECSVCGTKNRGEIKLCTQCKTFTHTCCVAPSSITKSDIKLLIIYFLPAKNELEKLKGALREQGHFSIIDELNCRVQRPTLGLLRDYDSVLVIGYKQDPLDPRPWKEPETLGDILAEYVLGTRTIKDCKKGGVVLCILSSTLALGGNWRRYKLNPFLPGRQSTAPFLNLDEVPQPTHPIASNVTSIKGGEQTVHSQGSVNESGANVILRWSNGTPLATILDEQKRAERGKIVSLNFFPNSITMSTEENPGFWDSLSSGTHLLSNALRFVAEPSYHKESGLYICHPCTEINRTRMPSEEPNLEALKRIYRTKLRQPSSKSLVSRPTTAGTRVETQEVKDIDHQNRTASPLKLEPVQPFKGICPDPSELSPLTPNPYQTSCLDDDFQDDSNIPVNKISKEAQQDFMIKQKERNQSISSSRHQSISSTRQSISSIKGVVNSRPITSDVSKQSSVAANKKVAVKPTSKDSALDEDQLSKQTPEGSQSAHVTSSILYEKADSTRKDYEQVLSDSNAKSISKLPMSIEDLNEANLASQPTAKPNSSEISKKSESLLSDSTSKPTKSEDPSPIKMKAKSQSNILESVQKTTLTSAQESPRKAKSVDVMRLNSERTNKDKPIESKITRKDTKSQDVINDRKTVSAEILQTKSDSTEKSAQNLLDKAECEPSNETSPLEHRESQSNLLKKSKSEVYMSSSRLDSNQSTVLKGSRTDLKTKSESTASQTQLKKSQSQTIDSDIKDRNTQSQANLTRESKADLKNVQSQSRSELRTSRTKLTESQTNMITKSKTDLKASQSRLAASKPNILRKSKSDLHTSQSRLSSHQNLLSTSKSDLKLSQSNLASSQPSLIKTSKSVNSSQPRLMASQDQLTRPKSTKSLISSNGNLTKEATQRSTASKTNLAKSAETLRKTAQSLTKSASNSKLDDNSKANEPATRVKRATTTKAALGTGRTISKQVVEPLSTKQNQSSQIKKTPSLSRSKTISQQKEDRQPSSLSKGLVSKSDQALTRSTSQGKSIQTNPKKSPAEVKPKTAPAVQNAGLNCSKTVDERPQTSKPSRNRTLKESKSNQNLNKNTLSSTQESKTDPKNTFQQSLKSKVSPSVQGAKEKPKRVDSKTVRDLNPQKSKLIDKKKAILEDAVAEEKESVSVTARTIVVKKGINRKDTGRVNELSPMIKKHAVTPKGHLIEEDEEQAAVQKPNNLTEEEEDVLPPEAVATKKSQVGLTRRGTGQVKDLAAHTKKTIASRPTDFLEEEEGEVEEAAKVIPPQVEPTPVDVPIREEEEEQVEGQPHKDSDLIIQEDSRGAELGGNYVMESYSMEPDTGGDDSYKMEPDNAGNDLYKMEPDSGDDDAYRMEPDTTGDDSYKMDYEQNNTESIEDKKDFGYVLNVEETLPALPEALKTRRLSDDGEIIWSSINEDNSPFPSLSQDT